MRAVQPKHLANLIASIDSAPDNRLFVDEDDYAGAVQRLLAAEAITQEEVRHLLDVGRIHFVGHGRLIRYELIGGRA